MKRFSNLAGLVFAGLLLLTLAACSADGPAVGEPPAVPAAVAQVEPLTGPVTTPPRVTRSLPVAAPTPELAPASEVLPAGDGQRGGYIVVAGAAYFPHQDVHQSSQEALASLGPGLAYSRLLRVSSGQEGFGPGQFLECDLCESWELRPDMSYQFRLRPDVRWHHVAPVNGRPLVAEDLVYSYQRMRTEGWPGAARFADRGIGDIWAVNDHALRVEMDYVDSDALLALADGRSKIVAQEVVEQYGDLRQAPAVGTGPWVWQQTTPDTGVDLTRNPTYFVPELPHLDGLNVKAVGNEGGYRMGSPASARQQRVALLRAGQIDAAVVPPTDWAQLQQSSAAFNARVAQRPEIGLALYLNTQEPPLDNLAVRRAIFKAVDPWEYVDVNWLEQGGVGLGMPLPGPDWRLSRNEMHADYLASPSEARDILAEHRFFSPVELELVVANLGPDYLALGRQVANDLRSVGFAPALRSVSPNYLKKQMDDPNREYQVALGPVPPHPTTNGYLYALLHSRGPGNITGHQDARLDQLIEEQARELNPSIRRAQLLQLQRRVMDQAYMFSPITGSYHWVFDWDLKDFYPNMALSEYHYWAEAWLEGG